LYDTLLALADEKEAAGKREPECFMVFAQHAGGGETGWAALPGFANETEKGVRNMVLDWARKQYYKGTVEGYLLQQAWGIFPLYLAPQPSEPAPVDAPLPEPYAWRAIGGTIWGHKSSQDDVPLFTGDQMRDYARAVLAAQQKTEPALLTWYEIRAVHDTYYRPMGPVEYARAIEAAVLKKNGLLK
jgi:hypothetical protein